MVLKSQGYNIPTLRIIEYYLSGNAIGFFFPMVILGGEIFRGYDLKEKYSVPWPKSIASVFIDRFLEITINAIVIIFGIFFLFSKVSFLSQKIGIALFLLAISTAIAVVVFYFKSFRKESIIKFFLKKLNLRHNNGADTMIDVEKEIFAYFGPNKKTMWQGFGLSLITQLILTARTFFLVLFLGKQISFLGATAVVAFSFLAITLPIPAALGSHEAVQSFVFNAFGLGANIGMAFVFIVRGAELAVALLGLIFFFRFGIQMMESIVFKKIAKLIKIKQ